MLVNVTPDYQKGCLSTNKLIWTNQTRDKLSNGLQRISKNSNTNCFMEHKKSKKIKLCRSWTEAALSKWCWWQPDVLCSVLPVLTTGMHRSHPNSTKHCLWKPELAKTKSLRFSFAIKLFTYCRHTAANGLKYSVMLLNEWMNESIYYLKSNDHFHRWE